MSRKECPKCHAALPRKGQFCLDCGFDLYAAGLHHRPIPWFHILVLPLVLAGLAALLIVGPGKGDTAPEVKVVVEQTQGLLALLAQKDYAGAVEQYFRANAARFAAAEEKLRDIARGEGAQGLRNAQSHGFRNLDETLAYVRKHGTKHPDYIARLLYAIVSRPEPNPWLSPRRAELFFEWYLEQSFGRADTAHAQIAAQDARWEDGLMTVNVRYPEPPELVPGAADPSVLRWRLVGSAWGGCGKQRAVLDFGTDDHLAEFLDLLTRLPAD
ncbi:MAG TPA: hypothetical protein PLE19_08440 [Planctomycetota bacterium]|nr:hypothetical protein [Planctomycetota bacterium]HRR82062.1 hypothetical protein [Planctomycetota bacterium]HRT94515.1 hypothetical protein [Planctomycetota bacterium]